MPTLSGEIWFSEIYYFSDILGDGSKRPDLHGQRFYTPCILIYHICECVEYLYALSTQLHTGRYIIKVSGMYNKNMEKALVKTCSKNKYKAFFHHIILYIILLYYNRCVKNILQRFLIY